jgi:hypothetical protein
MRSPDRLPSISAIKAVISSFEGRRRSGDRSRGQRDLFGCNFEPCLISASAASHHWGSTPALRLRQCGRAQSPHAPVRIRMTPVPPERRQEGLRDLHSILHNWPGRPPETTTKVISLSGLDLATPEGQREARSRLAKAAQQTVSQTGRRSKSRGLGGLFRLYSGRAGQRSETAHPACVCPDSHGGQVTIAPELFKFPIVERHDI